MNDSTLDRWGQTRLPFALRGIRVGPVPPGDCVEKNLQPQVALTILTRAHKQRFHLVLFFTCVLKE